MPKWPESSTRRSFQVSRPLSKEDTERMWRFGTGPMRNKSHVPKLWEWVGFKVEAPNTLGADGTAVEGGCDPCKGKDRTIPSLFSDYTPRFDKSKVTVVDSTITLPPYGG